MAQTPRYVNSTVVNSSNNRPFGTSNSRTQFLFQPSTFANVRPQVLITKIYFLAGSNSSSVNYSNFSVKMKDTVLSGFASGTWVNTGFQNCLTAGSYTLQSTTSGSWFSITLQQPFYHDATKALIVDISQTGGSGGPSLALTSSFGTVPVSFIHGTTGSGTGTTSGFVANFGFDPQFTYNDVGVISIDSPVYSCVGIPTTFKATIKNYGFNQINGVSINWSINGNFQFPAYYPSLIDTILGSNSNSVQITLGVGTPLSSPIEITAWTSNPNGTPDTLTTNDSITVIKQSSMSGFYTINPFGSGANNFTSFSSAVNSLVSKGICSSVIFNVQSGIYNEAINLPAIPGASFGKTITFQSIADNPDSVIVIDTFAVPINISGSFINLKAIKFHQVASNLNCLMIGGTLSYDTIYNCKFIAGVNSSTNNYTMYSNGYAMNGVVFRKNFFSGSKNGFRIFSTPNWSTNCIIDSNTFEGAYTSPLSYLKNTINLKVRNNIINVNGLGAASTFWMEYNDSAFEFSGNMINVSSGITSNIYLANYNIGNATNRIKIFNNMFQGGTIFIYVYFFNNYMDIFNNVYNSLGTVDWGYLSNNMRLYNNTFNSSGSYPIIIHNGSSSGLDIRNNVFSSTGGNYAASWTTTPINEICDNNNYYSNGPNIIYNTAISMAYSHLSTWRAASFKDSNSISYFPAFTNANNLQPSALDSACWSLNGRGVHLPLVNRDIIGNLRPNSTLNGVPDIGAYELTPIVPPPYAIASPVVPTAGTTQAFTFGGDTIQKINWAASSMVPPLVQVQQYSGVIPPQVDSTTKHMWFYTNTIAPIGSYDYSINLYYKDQWLGTCPTESNLILAKKNAISPWITYPSSSIDISKNIITQSSLTSFSYFTGSDAVFLLPVKLLDFVAFYEKESIKLMWATAFESNCKKFEIERSLDGGQNFYIIGNVMASGNSNFRLDYSFIDQSISHSSKSIKNAIYYRLRILDNDGTVEFSNIVEVGATSSDSKENVYIYPNPFKGELFVRISYLLDKKISLVLTDVQGRILFSKTEMINSDLELVKIPIEHELKGGIYIMHVKTLSNNYSIKLIKE